LLCSAQLNHFPASPFSLVSVFSLFASNSQISYDMLVIIVSILMMLFAANTLNGQHVAHRKILLKKLAEMQRHVSLLSGTDPASQKYAAAVLAAKRMVGVAIQVIETEDELNPVQILGFDANANLVRAMITAGGSGLIAAGKLLADARSNGSSV
jgi:hypothetical protein